MWRGGQVHCGTAQATKISFLDAFYFIMWHILCSVFMFTSTKKEKVSDGAVIVKNLCLALANLLVFSTFLHSFARSFLSKLLRQGIHKSSHKLLWVRDAIIEDSTMPRATSLMYDFCAKAKAYGNQLLFLHWNAGKRVTRTCPAVA